MPFLTESAERIARGLVVVVATLIMLWFYALLDVNMGAVSRFILQILGRA